MQPILGDGYSRTLAAWLDNLEAQRVGMVAKYGSQFYEGFRAFYYVCVEARAAYKHPFMGPETLAQQPDRTRALALALSLTLTPTLTRPSPPTTVPSSWSRTTSSGRSSPPRPSEARVRAESEA